MSAHGGERGGGGERGRGGLRIVLAAAASWVAVGATLLALPATRPTAQPVRPVPSHRAATVVWASAHRVYDEVDRRARRLGQEERTRVARAILEETARAELAPLLVLAVIHVESGFEPRAVSPAGAVGLMQLMPPTFRVELSQARLAAADPFDPVANVRAGVRYLARMVDEFDDVELALMAYNAGPNRIRRHLASGGIPERFFGYPRKVLRRAEGREPSSRAAHARAARASLAAAHAPRDARAAPPRRAPDVPALSRTSRVRVAFAPAEIGLPAGRVRDRPRYWARALPL